MANENKKDFNAMMKNNKDMPKIQIIEDDKIIKRYGGNKMFFAPPIFYNELMKKVITAMIVGIVIGFFRYKNKNVYSSMLVHTFINTFGS